MTRSQQTPFILVPHSVPKSQTHSPSPPRPSPDQSGPVLPLPRQQLYRCDNRPSCLYAPAASPPRPTDYLSASGSHHRSQTLQVMSSPLARVVKTHPSPNKTPQSPSK